MRLLDMTRRAVLASGTALALALARPACSTNAPRRPRRGPGGRAAGARPPIAVTAVNDFRILMNVYDGLVRYASGTLEVEPALATDWTISEDGTVYTFHAARGRRLPRRHPLQRRGRGLSTSSAC